MIKYQLYHGHFGPLFGPTVSAIGHYLMKNLQLLPGDRYDLIISKSKLQITDYRYLFLIKSDGVHYMFTSTTTINTKYTPFPLKRRAGTGTAAAVQKKIRV